MSFSTGHDRSRSRQRTLPLLASCGFVVYSLTTVARHGVFVGSMTTGTDASRPHQRSLTTRQSTASAVRTEVAYDEVTDFAGNGSAYALRPGVVPQDQPMEEAVRYDIDTFSPGFVVDNVLGDAACERLVQLCEEIGWSHRWSQSLGVVTLYLDEETERGIFQRLLPFLPNHMGGKPIGINRRWAVIKYGPGQYMNSHIDGHVPGTELADGALQYATGTRSYMTALFWLDDDVVGGETVFTFPQGGTWVKIPPKKGASLLFNHGQNAVSNPMHHGGSVEAGVKYIVRADVIYGHN
mmetsp:Transcript_59705/g.142057  ORF Transcript_59705/g.142057 Transcript_59705/m.142057 type:complete len:295 (+) Transcript_59705:57-941(+)